MSQLPAAAWLCPACQSYHAPHVDTCPRPFSNQQQGIFQKVATEQRAAFGQTEQRGHFSNLAQSGNMDLSQGHLAPGAFNEAVVSSDKQNANADLERVNAGLYGAGVNRLNQIKATDPLGHVPPAPTAHASDCAMNLAPAYPPGPCDCNCASIDCGCAARDG
jgi:hypothetical protein